MPRTQARKLTYSIRFIRLHRSMFVWCVHVARRLTSYSSPFPSTVYSTNKPNNRIKHYFCLSAVFFIHDTFYPISFTCLFASICSLFSIFKLNRNQDVLDRKRGKKLEAVMLKLLGWQMNLEHKSWRSHSRHLSWVNCFQVDLILMFPPFDIFTIASNTLYIPHSLSCHSRQQFILYIYVWEDFILTTSFS